MLLIEAMGYLVNHYRQAALDGYFANDAAQAGHSSEDTDQTRNAAKDAAQAS